MLMQLDGTFVFVVISFLIFLFIIKTLLYRPITGAIDEREKFLAKNSQIEKECKEKSIALVEDKERRIKQARNEAGEHIKEVSTEAKEKCAVIIKKTKKEIKEAIEENRKNLEESSHNSKIDLKSEVSGFVALIVSKILNEQTEVSIEEDRINKYLKI